MSNRGATTVYDDTGASHGVVLGKGELVVDTSDGGRVRIGDGVTPGGVPHVTRYPANPATVVPTNHDDLYAGFLTRFFDAANNRLFPCRGLGLDNSGCPDPTLPDANGNKLSPWMWAMGVLPLAERWRATGAAADQARVAGAWAYVQTQFTSQQMVSPVYGTNRFYGLMDDAALLTNVYMDIGDVTGNATAYRTAIEAHAAAYSMFADTRAGNPITSYGVRTPGGLPVQRNVMGLQYDQTKGVGDIATSHELFLGICAWRIAQLPDATIAAFYSSNGLASAQALKAALLNLAQDTWTWGLTYLRWPGTAKAVAGIYASAINLGPNDPNRFKVQYGMDNERPTTRRGYTCFADHGTLGAGVLSDMLYTTTGGAKYLAELQSVATAYPTPTTGFGRRWNGLPCLVNTQDPWTDGLWHAVFTRRLLARYPNPTDYSAFKLAVLGASKVIAAQSAYGLISANWGPPEMSGGASCFTWEQDLGNEGGGGGGQADGRQVMTAASSLLLIQAAAMLAGTEAALGSGMSPGAIEVLTGVAAAALSGVAASRFRETENIGPYSRRVIRDNTFREFIQEKEIRRLTSQGQNIYGDESVFGTQYVLQSIYAETGSVNAFSNSFGGNLYLGQPGGFPGLNLGMAGTFLNASTLSGVPHISVVVGNNEIVRATPNDAYVNGGLHIGYHLTPTVDNQLNIGSTDLRLAGIYLGNQPNVSSDASLKQDVTAYTPAEIACARDVAKIICRFRMIQSVEEKGDLARWQSGVIAQQVVQAMQAHGLVEAPADGSIATDIRYTFVGHDIWEAQEGSPEVAAVPEVSHYEDRDGRQVLVIDIPGVPGRPAIPAIAAGARYVVRYEALLVWIAAAHEQALAALEAELPTLAARVTALENAHAQ